MPGAKAKFITDDIKKIQELQEEVSAWASRLAGVKVPKDYSLEEWGKELLLHISGLGHLEVLKVAELQRIDTKSAAYKFQQAVNKLALSMGTAHISWQNKILMKESEEDQMAQVKAYARAHKKSVDDFKVHWHVDHLPTEVQAKYHIVEGLAR